MTHSSAIHCCCRSVLRFWVRRHGNIPRHSDARPVSRVDQLRSPQFSQRLQSIESLQMQLRNFVRHDTDAVADVRSKRMRRYLTHLRLHVRHQWRFLVLQPSDRLGRSGLHEYWSGQGRHDHHLTDDAHQCFATADHRAMDSAGLPYVSVCILERLELSRWQCTDDSKSTGKLLEYTGGRIIWHIPHFMRIECGGLAMDHPDLVHWKQLKRL